MIEKFDFSKQLTVVSHAKCTDGFCSAWMIKTKYPNSKILFRSYDDPIVEIKNSNLILVDFSYPKDTIKKLYQENNQLLVLDHHLSAKKNLSGLPYCIFDMNKSGCGLVYEYLRPKTPKFISDYVQDRDLWLHKLPYTKEINAYLYNLDFDFNVWDELVEIDKREMYKKGKVILDYQEKITKRIAQNAFEVTLDKSKVLAVQSSLFNSDLGEILGQGRDFAIVYYKNNLGNWIYSLRSSKSGKNVAKIAEKFGGGGHFHSSGFVLNKDILSRN